VNRLGSFLLALLLAFQATWALAAPYCSHEQGAEAVHVGHHAHRHEHAPAALDARTGEATEAASSLSGDPDCPGCQGGCTVLTVTVLPVVLTPASPIPPQSPTGWLPPSPVFALERPNWLALA